jgi:hypothetical protein
MTVLDQIGQDKQRIAERLARLDAERAKLSNQLAEFEVAERALGRFGGRKVAAEKTKKVSAKTATAAVRKPNPRARQQAPAASLGEATLKAVKAHAKGVSADDVRKYLSRKFGLTVRPNHLGSALQRHVAPAGWKTATSVGSHRRRPR